jgi:pimeloyl-ACP methyl ester carboxylesterase
MLPHWKEHEIVVDGIKTHYVRTGADEKPPLVLLHGFSDHGLCWLPVARDLEAEWDVILPDARGHGKSERVQSGGTYDHPADITGLIRSLGLEKPVVGGHSMGAATASNVEARFPNLVKALVLEDPPWRDFTPPPPPPSEEQGQAAQKAPPPNRWFEWLNDLAGTPLEDVIAKCRADNPSWAEVELKPWAESKLQLDTNVFKAEFERRPWQEVVKAIHVPTLLLTGDPEKGAIVTLESARQATGLSPWIRVVAIPGVGHNVRRENYPAFMRAVKAFLDEVK